MRVFILLILLVFLAPAQTAYDDTLDNAIEFNTSWNKFARSLFGCPMDATDVSECKPNLGVFDYAEYMTARKHAKKLFGLKEAN